jgi:threonine synthase
LVYESQPEDQKSFSSAGQQIKQWMQDLKGKGAFQVDARHFELAKKDFISERVSDGQTRDTILKYFTASSSSYLIDPHTAVGFHAANRIESQK